ncbi:hypothetical protein IE077_002889 [Cardiosporidium cionae]|uniref:C3H1-type domain-containing protein n=1 Tax=Cardiosporidium cionae TaxID=476202 RepID=A0ABQ7JFD8_9APIC|nr:hypothetical protein IE077_002889 [Cardiosporidium cionae]|eukprot:KAF8822725.1 hypothetical protein IE077_002889 [Cardiosporidium cionae]
MDSADTSSLPPTQVLLNTITEKLRSVLGIDDVDILTEYIMHLLSHKRATSEYMCKELREFLGEQAESFVQWVLELVNSQQRDAVLSPSPVDMPLPAVDESTDEKRTEKKTEEAPKADLMGTQVFGKKEQESQKPRPLSVEARRREDQRSRMFSLAVKQAALTTSTPVTLGKRTSASLPVSTTPAAISTTNIKRRRMEGSTEKHIGQEGRLVSWKVHAEHSQALPVMRKAKDSSQRAASRSVLSELHLKEVEGTECSNGTEAAPQTRAEAGPTKEVSSIRLTPHTDSLDTPEANSGRVRLVEHTKATSIKTEVSNKNTTTVTLKEKSKAVLTPSARFLSNHAMDVSRNESFIPYPSEIPPVFRTQTTPSFPYETTVPSHGSFSQSMGVLPSDASLYPPHVLTKQFPAPPTHSPFVFAAGQPMQTPELTDESPLETTKWTSAKLSLGETSPATFPFGKIRKRCVNWPNCTFGDNCRFIHPAEKCETWPNCPYGNECFYVHPEVPCKFGAKCYNAYCNYSHSEVTNTQGFTKTRSNGLFVNQTLSFLPTDGSNGKNGTDSSQIQFNKEVEKISDTMPSTPPSLKAQAHDLPTDAENSEYASFAPMLQLNSS